MLYRLRWVMTGAGAEGERERQRAAVAFVTESVPGQIGVYDA